MIFTKMHGLGNDYVCINCFRERVEDPPGFARTLCDRHFGIGADGLILICPSKVSDFNMKVHVTNSGFRLDTESFLSGKSVIIYIFSKASDAIAAHPGNRSIRIVYLHFKIRHL